MNKNLCSKNVYKIFLSLVKYLPLCVALLKILNISLNYFGIQSAILLFFGGTSFTFLLLLYIIAIIFKYCYLYKMPLYYIITTDVFYVITKIITIEVLDIYRIHAIIAGIFMITYIAYAYLTRNNPNRKIDYIKDFCERYCSC